VGDARGGAACAAAAYDDAPRVHDAGRRDGISPENRSQQKSPKDYVDEEKGDKNCGGGKRELLDATFPFLVSFCRLFKLKRRLKMFRAAIDGE